MLDFTTIVPPDNALGSSGQHGYDDHWLVDPTRDKPMGHRCRMRQEELTKALQLPLMKTKTQTDILHIVAADVIMTARMHPGRRISYSRSDKFYKKRRQYTPDGYNLANVTAAVDLLENLGYILDHDRRPPGRRGTQSSFLPNPSLSMLLLPAVYARPDSEIVMKDVDGNVVPYKESGRVHDLRQVVRLVNAVLEETDIVLDAEGLVADGPLLRKGNYVLNPALKSLYRVFNGGWLLGGRFYGGWWQAVSGADRRYFLIDGERTEEVDYSQIHPRIIYAEAGVLLEGDAYTISGFDRDLVKSAFNILVNAPCYLSALGAIRNELKGDRNAAEALIEAVKARHPLVSKYFHSAAGVRLQGLDSRMAEIVLSEMTVKRGIPVLPVHDSFIVPESHRETLIQVMKDAFESVVGRTGNRDKIIKSSGRNTATRSSAYGSTDYRQPVRAGAERLSSLPLSAVIIDSPVSESRSQPFDQDLSPLPVPSELVLEPPRVEAPKPVSRTPAPSFLHQARERAKSEWEQKEAALLAKRGRKIAQGSPPDAGVAI